MGIIVTATAGLIIWIILWAQGIKAFDGFLIVILLLLVAVVSRAALGLLPGARDE
jgi:hypothetical protein